jgi:hypothetical protein
MAGTWNLVMRKEYDTALAEYTKLHEKDPTSEPLLCNRGIVCLLMGSPAPVPRNTFFMIGSVISE